MQWTSADYNAQTILWQLSLGWALLTFTVLLLFAIILDVFQIRLLDKMFRKWIYGVFLVGLLGGVSASFLGWIKIDPNTTAVEVSPKALDQAAKQAYQPPPPAPPLPLAPTVAVNKSNYSVIIQFAGVLLREDIVEMAKTLNDAGWKVVGGDGGGERTSAASGYNQVRYSGANEFAAIELARQVQAINLTGKAVDVVRLSSIESKTLKIWISR